MRKCPKCGKINNDDWPLEVNGEIKDGGCQLCWESECSDEWWEIMTDKKKGTSDGYKTLEM